MSGPGAAPGHWRSGLHTTLGARLPSWPIGVRAHASWAVADTLDSAVDASWWSASAGPHGVYEPLGWLRLSAGVDLGAEWLLVTLRDGGSGNQRQSRAYLTLRPWATATVWVNRWLGIRVGAEFYTTPGQALRVDGEFVGQNRTFGVLGLSGVDLRLLQ